ncbi:MULTISPECIES: helix-turn-helix transcriptional regulator [unclassified Amycolatopsis]|uniref:helix-turn-helix domain-containing protein n=1 Tax=unclassified Amycolatopsis TaxID=2618356 RepID=UPI001C6956D9|nr:helix-turn-helix transcriptional regulator [Amycolatopsis sp. DSM 110486]QYN19256.1 helix-turn-helix domain-containing protein [Amycolatopsis sp. DSM 110486]
MAGERRPNIVLIALREQRGLSQHELAGELNRLATTKYHRETNLTKKSVWRWERGDTEKPKGFFLQLLSDFFDVAITELGFLRHTDRCVASAQE